MGEYVGLACGCPYEGLNGIVHKGIERGIEQERLPKELVTCENFEKSRFDKCSICDISRGK